MESWSGVREVVLGLKVTTKSPDVGSAETNTLLLGFNSGVANGASQLGGAHMPRHRHTAITANAHPQR